MIILTSNAFLLGEPIFSIDIHPDGSRFATCGQGKVGVKIWNMLPVIDAVSEADENIPKILCNIENHMGKSTK